MKIDFHGEPVYGDNDKYINTKIKIYGGIVNTNFQDKGMAKEKVRKSKESKEKVLSSKTFGRM